MSLPTVTSAQVRQFWLKYGRYTPYLILVLCALIAICIFSSKCFPEVQGIVWAISTIVLFEWLFMFYRLAKRRQRKLGPLANVQADLARLDTATTLAELREVVGLKEP